MGPSTEPDTRDGCPRRCSTWQLLAGLAALSAFIHGWLLWKTEVPASDTVTFIRIALELEQGPVADVLRQAHQHPLYPAAILGASLPVRWFLGTTPAAMVLSSQLVSCVASLLLIFPMFYLGRELFDRRVGFWATALVQCLPVTARATADGLTEATFLFLATASLLLGALALRRASPARFAWCGLLGGLAYLTRPEGILTVVACGFALVLAPLLGGRRQSWRQALACGGFLAIGASLSAGPYMATIGGFSNKPTTNRLWKSPEPATDSHADRRSPTPNIVEGSRLFAVWSLEPDTDRPFWWGAWAVGLEVLKGFYYVAVLPALLGLYWFRGRWRSSPAAWLLAVLVFLQLAVLCRMAQVVGYVSERHVQLLVVAGSFWVVAALLAVCDRMAVWVRRPWLAWALPALLMATGLPQALRPAHAERVGHRAAGYWLAANTRPDERVLDPTGWASLYGGRMLQRTGDPPAGQPPCYIVLEDRARSHPGILLMAEALEMVHKGKIVFHWEPARRRHREEPVTIYHVSATKAQ